MAAMAATSATQIFFFHDLEVLDEDDRAYVSLRVGRYQFVKFTFSHNQPISSKP